MPHSAQRAGAPCAHRLSFVPSRRRTLEVKAASGLPFRATMSCPPLTRSTTRGPSRDTLPLLLLAAWLRVSCGFDGSAGESGTYQTRSGTLKTRYQRITVTSGDSPSTVKWSLDCEGLVDPVVGGAPFDGMIAVPPGECYLTMTDTHCAGWNGAEWSAPGWTDESYSASASELCQFRDDEEAAARGGPRASCEESPEREHEEPTALRLGEGFDPAVGVAHRLRERDTPAPGCSEWRCQ